MNEIQKAADRAFVLELRDLRRWLCCVIEDSRPWPTALTAAIAAIEAYPVSAEDQAAAEREAREALRVARDHRDSLTRENERLSAELKEVKEHRDCLSLDHARLCEKSNLLQDRLDAEENRHDAALKQQAKYDKDLAEERSQAEAYWRTKMETKLAEAVVQANQYKRDLDEARAERDSIRMHLQGERAAPTEVSKLQEGLQAAQTALSHNVTERRCAQLAEQVEAMEHRIREASRQLGEAHLTERRLRNHLRNIKSAECDSNVRLAGVTAERDGLRENLTEARRQIRELRAAVKAHAGAEHMPAEASAASAPGATCGDCGGTGMCRVPSCGGLCGACNGTGTTKADERDVASRSER